MSEVSYIKLTSDRISTLEVFNVSIFDVLFLFGEDENLIIKEFYSVDKYGTDKEIHLIEKDLTGINKIGELFFFFDDKGIYGEEFTINIIDFEIGKTRIKLKDDFNLKIYFDSSNDSKDIDVFIKKILRLLKFNQVKKVFNIIKGNQNKYILFDENSNYEICNNYDELSKTKTFGGKSQQ